MRDFPAKPIDSVAWGPNEVRPAVDIMAAMDWHIDWLM